MRLLSWGSSVLGPCPRLLLVIPGMCPLSVVGRKWSSPNMPTMLKETISPLCSHPYSAVSPQAQQGGEPRTGAGFVWLRLR